MARAAVGSQAAGTARDRVADRTRHLNGDDPEGFRHSAAARRPAEKEIQSGALWLVRRRERPLSLPIVLASRQRGYAPPAVSAMIGEWREYWARNPARRPAGSRDEP